MTETTPENGYPENWDEISLAVRERSEGCCECMGECGLHRDGRCVERNGEAATFARGRIVLTVAHLDHNPGNNTVDLGLWQRGDRLGPGNNLKAMCQRCHLLYDLELHMLHRLRNQGAIDMTEPEIRANALLQHEQRVMAYRAQMKLPA